MPAIAMPVLKRTLASEYRQFLNLSGAWRCAETAALARDRPVPAERLP
jgi:hypothetical protein